MQRFILQQNIERFRQRLAEASDEADRRRLTAMLAGAERELALVNTAMSGVQLQPAGALAPDEAARKEALARFRAEIAPSSRPSLLIDPQPGLPIAEVNAPYEAVCGLDRKALIGQPLFLLFPDNPDDPIADGVSHLYASLKKAAESGRPHAMEVQRYDVRDGDGRFVERYWRPLNTPLTDGFGRVVFLLHQVDEVTDEVLGGKGAG
ncbi:PAS domain-containing protein [Phenylobacterium soli]|uniref:PAS domain-containing protein n=1 Tax=Phenylobacterium soli TaxID=2170551 RepID=UPI001873D975|nr:PAS domain-containing protein [Phenylobacterium soli]